MDQIVSPSLLFLYMSSVYDAGNFLEKKIIYVKYKSISKLYILIKNVYSFLKSFTLYDLSVQKLNQEALYNFVYYFCVIIFVLFELSFSCMKELLLCDIVDSLSIFCFLSVYLVVYWSICLSHAFLSITSMDSWYVYVWLVR